MTAWLLLLVLSSPAPDAASPYCQRADRAAFSEQATAAVKDIRYHPRYCLMAKLEPAEGALITHSEHAGRMIRQLSRAMRQLTPEDQVALADAVMYRASRRFWLSVPPHSQGSVVAAALRENDRVMYFGLRFFQPEQQVLLDDWWAYLQQGDFQRSYQPHITRLAESILYNELARARAAAAERQQFHCSLGTTLSDLPGHRAVFPALFSPRYCLMLEPSNAEAQYLAPLTVEGLGTRFMDALTKLETVEQQANFIDLFLRTLSRLNWTSMELPAQHAAEQGTIRVHFASNRPERLQQPYLEIQLFGEEANAELAHTLLQLQLTDQFRYPWPIPRLVDLVLFASEAEQPRAPPPAAH